MKHRNITPIVLVVCVIAVGLFILFKYYWEKEYAEYVKKTNEEVVSIMDSYVPEIKELFYRNKEVFVEEISKDTPSDTIIVDDEKVSIRIGDAVTHSTIIKNVVYFTINSTVGTKGACFYDISIIYSQNELPMQVSDDNNYVKLDDGWYIKKRLSWGT